MELRPELMPPALDETLVARLAKLAAQLDGDPDEDKRAEFNRLAGTDIPMQEFQGIYGGEDHEDYVRRVLYYRLIKPAPCVTRAELAEVVRRAMPQNGFFEQHEAYMAVFDANVPLEGGLEPDLLPARLRPGDEHLGQRAADWRVRSDARADRGVGVGSLLQFSIVPKNTLIKNLHVCFSSAERSTSAVEPA